MTDYSNDPVMLRLAAARKGIGEQVAGATTEIDRRSVAADQSATGYDGTLSNIYAGLGDAANSPSLQILKASQNATTPLVQMGFTDLFQRQRGGLEQARLLEEGNLASQEAAFLSERQAADQDREFAKQQAAEERASRKQEAAAERAARQQESRASQRDPIADYAAKLGVDQRLGIGDFAPGAQPAPDPNDPKVRASNILGARNPNETDANWGGFFTYLDDPKNDDDHFSRIMNNPAYQHAAGMVMAAPLKDRPALAQRLSTMPDLDPAAASVLLYLYGPALGDGAYNNFLTDLYGGA